MAPSTFPRQRFVSGLSIAPVANTVYRLPLTNSYPQLAPLATVDTVTCRGASPL